MEGETKVSKHPVFEISDCVFVFGVEIYFQNVESALFGISTIYIALSVCLFVCLSVCLFVCLL